MNYWREARRLEAVKVASDANSGQKLPPELPADRAAQHAAT